MDAKICDRCGKYFREINQTAKIVKTDTGIDLHSTVKNVWEENPGFRITIKPYTRSVYLKKHYDLCPECAQKFQDFLLNKTEDTECKYCGSCNHTFCTQFESKEEE